MGFPERRNAMLRIAKEIQGYVLKAEDGDIGRCKDFLFDEQHWTIRYMVADTGRWLPGRKVLIAPIALGEPDWQNRRFPVRLTKEQIERAPSLDEDAPVSRQHETQYFQYYGWPTYWGGIGAWGAGAYPPAAPLVPPWDPQRKPFSRFETEAGDEHLRSVNEVTGYRVQAEDGEIGHVEDFIVDDATWTIHYLVVDTRNWLPGKKVIVPPSWSVSVDWGQSKVFTDLQQEQVRNSPEFDPAAPMNREIEERVYDFYGRPRYWTSDRE